MKKDLVEMVFILDRSGSMSGLESDTIGGFNSLIEKQKNTPGEALVSTVLFDDRFEVIHNRVPIIDVKPMTKDTYFVRGTTALLDTMGRSITKMIHVYRTLKEEEKPEKTLFIITTDGMENASKEFTHQHIKTLIDHQKEGYQWEFIFLGANIDSVYEGGKLGINPNRTARYHADKTGVNLNFKVVEEGIKAFRTNESFDDDWNKEIIKDYLKRK